MPSERRLHPLSFVFDIVGQVRQFVVPAGVVLVGAGLGGLRLGGVARPARHSVGGRGLRPRADVPLPLRSWRARHHERTHLPQRAARALRPDPEHRRGAERPAPPVAGRRGPHRDRRRQRSRSTHARAPAAGARRDARARVCRAPGRPGSEPTRPTALARSRQPRAAHAAGPRTARAPARRLHRKPRPHHRRRRVRPAVGSWGCSIRPLGLVFGENLSSTAASSARPLARSSAGACRRSAGSRFSRSRSRHSCSSIRVLSMCWSLIRLWGFRLHRTSDDLGTEFGLVTRVMATIPLRRIQTVTVRESPLHRVFKAASIRVDSAGGDGGEGSATRRESLAPIIRRADLPPRPRRGPTGCGRRGRRLAPGRSARLLARAQSRRSSWWCS